MTVHRASSDPTDRSMPPTRITNSCPTARHASGATCTARLERLSPVRKNGDTSVMITTSSARISAGPTRITRRTRLSPCSEDPPILRPSAGAAVLMAPPFWLSCPVRGLPKARPPYPPRRAGASCRRRRVDQRRPRGGRRAAARARRDGGRRARSRATAAARGPTRRSPRRGWAPSVAMVGAVGDDEFGAQALRELAGGGHRRERRGAVAGRADGRGADRRRRGGREPDRGRVGRERASWIPTT